MKSLILLISIGAIIEFPQVDPVIEPPKSGPEYHIGVIEPDSSIDYKILEVEIDPNIDYKLGIINPEIESVDEELKEELQRKYKQDQNGNNE